MSESPAPEEPVTEAEVLEFTPTTAAPDESPNFEQRIADAKTIADLGPVSTDLRKLLHGPVRKRLADLYTARRDQLLKETP
jgi:hypothetical protein